MKSFYISIVLIALIAAVLTPISLRNADALGELYCRLERLPGNLDGLSSEQYHSALQQAHEITGLWSKNKGFVEATASNYEVSKVQEGLCALNEYLACLSPTLYRAERARLLNAVKILQDSEKLSWGNII